MVKVSDIIANSSFQNRSNITTSKNNDISLDALKINVIKKGPVNQFPIVTQINAFDPIVIDDSAESPQILTIEA